MSSFFPPFYLNTRFHISISWYYACNWRWSNILLLRIVLHRKFFRKKTHVLKIPTPQYQRKSPWRLLARFQLWWTRPLSFCPKKTLCLKDFEWFLYCWFVFLLGRNGLMFHFWMQLQVALCDKGLCGYTNSGNTMIYQTVTPEGSKGSQIPEGVQFTALSLLTYLHRQAESFHCCII